MRLRDIPLIVRAAGSLLFIAAGVFLLYITWFNDGDDSETGVTPDPTATTVVVESRCPTGWVDFDNTATKFRICLPNTFVFSTGDATTPLAQADQTDPRFINDFHVVNMAWLSPWPATIPVDPVMPPIRLAVRVPGEAEANLDGCDPADAVPGPEGVQACIDLLSIVDGQGVVNPQGDFHRYRAMVPAANTPGGTLFIQVDSMAPAWVGLQEPMVRQIVESILPY